jgi:queuine tRNA-ribosyltransferase
MSNPGIDVLEKIGGIKNFMGFEGLVVSDSGGWQIFSLIHRNKKAGVITDEGVKFTVGGGKKKLFTPEECIDVQFKIGSDVMICLDDFTPPDAKKEKIKESVDRTVLWAEKCKKRYLKNLKKKKISEKDRPLLFAAIQGASNKKLRKECAEKLIEIGFDGYGFGGYLVDDKTGKLDLKMMEYLASLIPDESYRFSLGTGTPYEIAKLTQTGWDIFDCTLPTRDARHKRLYVFEKDPKTPTELRKKETHGFLYINKEKNKNDSGPISNYCDCYTCKNYSRAYLNHLFSIGDATAERLATIHNLRTYSKVTEVLR